MTPRRGRPARLAGGALSEDAWSGQVAGLAAFYGWQGYHTHDSRRSAAGFPDWVFVRGPELLFVELKPDKGAQRATVAAVAARPEWLRHRDLSDAQAQWLEALHVVSVAVFRKWDEVGDPLIEAHVWRPRDFEFVERRLSAGRHRQPSIHKPAEACE